MLAPPSGMLRKIFFQNIVINFLSKYNKKTPQNGEFVVDCMFFGADCTFYIKFKLIFAEKIPSSAEKSYIPSYLVAVEITERIPTP